MGKYEKHATPSSEHQVCDSHRFQHKTPKVRATEGYKGYMVGAVTGPIANRFTPSKDFSAQIHKFRFFSSFSNHLFSCKMGFRSNFRSPILDSWWWIKCIPYTRGPLQTILYLVSFWPPKLAWGKCLKLDVKEYSLKDIQRRVSSRVFERRMNYIMYLMRVQSMTGVAVNLSTQGSCRLQPLQAWLRRQCLSKFSHIFEWKAIVWKN